jgi:type IV secretory pathway VirB2 component (pilin)
MKKRTVFEELRKLFLRALLPALILLQAAPLHALGIGSSPWENAVNALEVSFTGPIARGLSLVAIVVGGLAFAFGEGDSKRMLAGIIFGLGMALGSVQLMSWLFG